jgi:DNA polymerase-1
VGKIGQNLKYDIQIFKRMGIEVKGIVADTLLESYLIDPDAPHNLDSLTLKYIDHKNISYEELTGKGKSQISFAEVPIEKATAYSCEDADMTFRLHEILYPKLVEGGMKDLYEEIEMPLVEVLAGMEQTGVLIDQKKLVDMGVALDREMEITQESIFYLAGEAININSPKQLSKLLFEKLKLPIKKKTKTGISTDESVLRELASLHPVCQQIIKFREMGKLKSTYVDGLMAQVSSLTGRVHTNYNQTVTATGRLSSSNPNLQNIPLGTEAIYDVRSVFIAKEGCEFLSMDYSQVELRLLADLSGDKELVRAFENDEDVHSYTAKQIFGVSEVNSEHRKIAKTINFGVVYGQTPYGLSQMLKISPSKAKEFIDRYFERYSGVQTYLQSLKKLAQEKGYASTRLGRKRYLPEITASNRMRREMAERAAINTPLQGTAADMIKIAMVSIDKALREKKCDAKMILQVHDELVFEVPENEKVQTEKLVREKMESALKLRIPLKVDVGWGKNWSEVN